MPEFTTTVSFEVFCGRCGKGICNNCTEGTTQRRRYPTLTINPCEYCNSNTHDEGFKDGYDAGKADQL